MSVSLDHEQQLAQSEEATVAPARPVAPPMKRQRSILIDVVRGLAIFLVAFGHSNQGVQHRGWWGDSLVGLRLDAFIYSFHMPAFFFVSGIFLRSSVAKRGELRFVRDKLRTMIWPYLLFSVISYVVLHFVGHLSVQTVPPLQQFVMLVVTGGLSWFLPTIFVTVLFGMLGRRLPAPLFFAFAIATSVWTPVLPLGVIMVACRFLPFLALGMWVSFGYEKIEQMTPLLAAAGALVLACWIAFMNWNLQPHGQSWRYLAMGFMGTLMLLLVARVLSRGKLGRAVAWIGEASFGIFLLSSFAQGFGRELILRLFHATNPWVQTLGATIFAVTLPAAVYAYRQRLRIGWMFIFPLREPAKTAT